jgi:hypothetical protein
MLQQLVPVVNRSQRLRALVSRTLAASYTARVSVS